EVHHLMTSAQFAELYTLAQVAPGPNFMYVTLIGWHLAGWAGAAATTIPILVPATTLTLLVGHLNERYPNAPIGRAIRRGLAPITIGLMFASDDTDAHGEPRLARIPDHAGHRSAGPAHVMEPAVAARGRCAGGHGRPCLSTESHSEQTVLKESSRSSAKENRFPSPTVPISWGALSDSELRCK